MRLARRLAASSLLLVACADRRGVPYGDDETTGEPVSTGATERTTGEMPPPVDGTTLVEGSTGGPPDDSSTSTSTTSETAGETTEVAASSSSGGEVLTTTGAPAFCGDGIVDAGEECDDADEIATDACASCKLAACGDGLTWLGKEECDDGNNVDDDGCQADCTLPCVPTGQRVPWSMGLFMHSECAFAPACEFAEYNANDRFSLSAEGEFLECDALQPVCIANVGITTWSSVDSGQGAVAVYCDGEQLGYINTIGKKCIGDPMTNGCSISFPPRTCQIVRFEASDPGQANDAAWCLGKNYIDMLISATGAW